jgi:hypothetical protein
VAAKHSSLWRCRHPARGRGASSSFRWRRLHSCSCRSRGTACSPSRLPMAGWTQASSCSSATRPQALSASWQRAGRWAPGRHCSHDQSTALPSWCWESSGSTLGSSSRWSGLQKERRCSRRCGLTRPPRRRSCSASCSGLSGLGSTLRQRSSSPGSAPWWPARSSQRSELIQLRRQTARRAQDRCSPRPGSAVRRPPVSDRPRESRRPRLPRRASFLHSPYCSAAPAFSTCKRGCSTGAIARSRCERG